ncbi:MAG: 16S rRNA (guanine(527)-N(7))-methyltransferase RsmG [Oscillospiraceae bacterium]|nr:16S rRNA (guanine(527)-N(7))-methyltransferase RsmG [Oscillospiraceae bacterium]
MIDKQRMVQTAQQYGIEIAHCIDQLDLYAQMLVEYNEKVNLTAITDPKGIEEKHFLDSLLFATQPQVQGKLVDVGTGAGFPGIVAKLYKPELQLTLMEPTGKRVEFLKFACEGLGIQAEFVKERAEEAARKQWREKFDVASARAVAGLNILSEYCLPLVKPEGWFIAMKAADTTAEKAEAGGAIKKLGGKLQNTVETTLPDGSVRTLVMCKKISQTPPQYPRNGGKISKSPLK